MGLIPDRREGSRIESHQERSCDSSKFCHSLSTIPAATVEEADRQCSAGHGHASWGRQTTAVKRAG